MHDTQREATDAGIRAVPGAFRRMPGRLVAAIAAYCLVCCALAFSFGPLLDVFSRSTNAFIRDVLLFCVLMAVAVGGAFCFYVPLLYLSRTVPRVVVSVALPSTVWLTMMGGLATVHVLDGFSFVESYKLFLVVLAGGAIPAGALVWCRSWHLYRGNDPLARPANRLIDIFVVTTACALFLAALRGGLSAAWPADMATFAMFAVLGAAAGLPSLTAIGALLDRKPSWKYKSNWIALLTSLGVVFAGWTVPFLVFGDPPNRDPVLFWLTLSCTTWLAIVATAIFSSLWFRRCGFRLATARDQQGM